MLIMPRSVKIISIIIVLILLLSMLIIVGYNNYSNHKDTVIRQQQEHLLTIAKSISRSLEVFIHDKNNNLSILAQNPIITNILEVNEEDRSFGKDQNVLKLLLKEYSDDIERIALFDQEGKVILQHPVSNSISQISLNPAVINRLLYNKEIFVSKEYESDTNQFSVDLLYPVFGSNQHQGILLKTINLDKVYKNLMDSIKLGKKGYVMVKNIDGVIVMHPVTEQIGIESIKVRREMFPDNDWRELEELHQKQIEEEEGYHIYHSKWWQDDELRWTKKINAYTTLKEGDISWVISVQMDYKEIEEPIKGTLVNISLIAFIITIVLLIVSYIIFQIDKKRKALEIETKYLKKLNKTWEELIKSEARLRHSQKLQTIGTLTSGVAHEFNNLLTPILGYSEILLRNMDNSNTMYGDLWEINKNALRAKEIIEQILMFSRNENPMPKYKELEVKAIVEESIKLIKSILPKNIKIVENISYNGLVFGNSTQLQQVLLNLYTNSYHAMKNKGGIIEINTSSLDITYKENHQLNLKEGEYVKIQVKDTGIGMTKEVLDQIFDPFFTTKEIGEGTGLGLSVVHSIIKSHNGDIFIESQLDLGTTIDIYLPVVDEKTIENMHESMHENINSSV